MPNPHTFTGDPELLEDYTPLHPCHTLQVFCGLIAAAMYDREYEILNYFVNRSTSASAGSLSAKIEDVRAEVRGIIDREFFLFRLMKICA